MKDPKIVDQADEEIHWEVSDEELELFPLMMAFPAHL